MYEELQEARYLCMYYIVTVRLQLSQTVRSAFPPRLTICIQFVLRRTQDQVWLSSSASERLSSSSMVSLIGTTRMYLADSVLPVIVLLLNAVSILSEDRFLARSVSCMSSQP